MLKNSLINLNRRVAAAVLLASALAPAAWADQTIDPAQSEVTFVAKQLGVPLDGAFKRYSVQMAFDPKKPADSRVALQIDLGSVAVNVDADRELRQPAWFNTAGFPKATFQSTTVKAVSRDHFNVTGKLSIKGQVRDVTIPVQMAQLNGVTVAQGAFTLKRLDFKVGEGDWADTSVVANDVQVRFKLVIKGVPAL